MHLNFELFKKTFSLFMRHIRFKNTATRLRCCIAVLLILVDVVAVTLVPYYTKFVIDALSLNILQTIWIAMSLLGFFWILEKTVNHVQEIIFFPVINNTIRDLSYNIVNHIHTISLPDYQKLSIPEVINCVRRISMSTRSFIKIVFLMIVPTIIKLIIASIVVIKTSLFGVILLPAILITLFMLYKGSQWYVAAREIAWQASDNVTMRVSDSILNTKIIRQLKPFEMDAIGTILDKEAACWFKSNTRLHTIHILIGALLGITIIGILSGSILAIQAGVLTIGDFVLLKGQLMVAFLPLKTLSVEFRQCAESLVDIKKIIHILEIPKQPNSLLKHTKNQPNTVFINNLDFSHDTEKPIFKNLSLEIQRNEKVAIVGESGSGKSTLIHLLAGLNKASRGYIYIDNQETKKILCIPQDFRLFNTSLRLNMTYGLDNVSDTKLLNIAKKTELLSLIQQMPNGLDTLVGEMGIKLSGGEKQKVALARALLLKPDILLLDETTSSLSVESENAILHTLFSEISTVILTSHRTSMLHQVDRIIRIQYGNLFEFKNSSVETEICL
jgi:ABC-type multidrug transport system fused ATPase/permease subunit